uniref:Uncharacterized protein n=1 Tax=Ditylenchus dipsaci TaxID=166011 RepID=A0A915CMK3_9BILA
MLLWLIPVYTSSGDGIKYSTGGAFKDQYKLLMLNGECTDRTSSDEEDSDIGSIGGRDDEHLLSIQLV